jgi:hypothetical protein
MDEELDRTPASPVARLDRGERLPAGPKQSRLCCFDRGAELDGIGGRRGAAQLEHGLDEREHVGACRERDRGQLRHGLADRDVRQVDRDDVDRLGI